MSEYQFYEFQAIDRPLTKAEQGMLRDLSSRARISATSFTNHYEWGDFKGNPKQLMERFFDLHLYLANWGTRQLMIRVPTGLFDRNALGAFLDEVDWVTVSNHGGHTIIDICRSDDEADYDDQSDEGRLSALAPLHGDILSGDLRLFYLLWLLAVEEGELSDDAPEPLPGIGPLTGALEAAAEFFYIDSDLVEAAAAAPYEEEETPGASRAFVEGLAEDERTRLLLRVMEGDANVRPELLQRVRAQRNGSERPRRTAGELRARAHEMRALRERAEAERLRAEKRRKAEEAERARRVRLGQLKQRGEDVWREIESEIERRNAPGYDSAAALLADLALLSAEQGTAADFSRRLTDIRERHERKGKFIERLRGL
ncbi:hypothetical protein GOB13_24015 [Sinorhizobium meliloti]|uniref:hypothetical protein n=1 Tax=Rhizobium meliloti TaxID=382 RepID=UPI00299D0CF5|nr:hypothetical protein [Sinorhizobium meliloti]MDX0084354.1 hypothetical protein [Sinorhizobium meliloti]